MLSIGDLSRRARVKVPTIRYYEQIGLMGMPDRSHGNQRRYGDEDLQRLRFIRHARDLGFTIEAIGELLSLSRHPLKACHRADEIAEAQLQAVRDKIAGLRRLEEELARILAHGGPHKVGDCHVIQSLADHGLCLYDH